MSLSVLLRNFLLALLVFSASTLPSFADGPCPVPGTRPATADDAVVKNGQIPVGTCYDQNGSLGQGPEEAKQYLLNIASGERNSKAPPDQAHINALNSSFAICAANFLKAYIEHYGPVHVVSAFRCGPRSPANIQCDRNENSNAGGATNSNHQLGTAMDLNPAGGNSSYETLRSFAEANQNYGVSFPWPFYNDLIDKNHMQAFNPTNPSCAGVIGSPVTPGSGPVSSNASSPSSAISNLLRQFLNPQQPQQPQQQGSGSQTQQPQQQLSSTQTPLSYTQTPVSDTISTTPTGSTNTGSNTNTNTNQNQNSNNSQNAVSSDIHTNTGQDNNPSAIDLINAIAYPTSTRSGVATSAPVGISSDLYNAVQVQQTNPTDTTNGNLATNATTQGPAALQTFTSQDLSQTPAQAFAVNPQTTFAWQILESLKQKLLWALSYLRPFGAHAHTSPPNSHTAYIE